MNIDITVDGRSLVKIDIDPAELMRVLGASMPGQGAIAKSTPMTKAQAEDLLSKVDPKSAHFLKQLAQNNGTMTWKDMRSIFGIKDEDDWGAYSGSYGKGITRAFRHMLQDKSARLVWWNDDDWGGELDSDMCAVFVDGPALEALRQASGLAR